MGRFNAKELCVEAQDFFKSHPLNGEGGRATWSEKFILETIQRNIQNTDQAQLTPSQKKKLENWFDIKILEKSFRGQKAYIRMFGQNRKLTLQTL